MEATYEVGQRVAVTRDALGNEARDLGTVTEGLHRSRLNPWKVYTVRLDAGDEHEVHADNIRPLGYNRATGELADGTHYVAESLTREPFQGVHEWTPGGRWTRLPPTCSSGTTSSPNSCEGWTRSRRNPQMQREGGRDIMLGAREVADLLGVKPQTVHMWAYRGLMPEREATVSGQPAWFRSTIEAWARANGRLAGEEGPSR